MMNLKISEVIIKYRKENGLTQEQLAKAVGVSTPAVSKWESGNTYPDIMLLAPIARLLGITTDKLLSYQEDLSDAEVLDYAKQMEVLFETKGVEAGYCKCEGLIHQYPNSNDLKYHFTLLYQRELALSRFVDEEQRAMVTNRIAEIYEQVLASKDPKLTSAVTVNLASLYMTTNQCDRAEKLLDSLPKTNVDADALYPMLYMIQGRVDEAAKLQENKLFRSVHAALAALGILGTISERKHDFTRALHIADLSDQMIELFDLRGAIGLDQKIRLLSEQGKIKDALDSFEIYVDKIMSLSFDYSNHSLFSNIELGTETQQYKKIKHLMVETLGKDKNYAVLQNEERFLRALEKLKRSIENR
jgi:transcriptional regulator with XRE-family HTH domain